MNKDLIQARFLKSLKHYNENAKVQKKMAEKVFNLIKNKSFNNILEIGCGTGFLTRLVSDNLDFKNYKAIDIVSDCELYIKEINSSINFEVADIEQFIKDSSETFDLIISNASLQWVSNFDNVIKELIKKLSSNGELIISTFGQENFREIYNIEGTTLKYYSINELKVMFPKAEINPEIHIMAFDNPKDVLKHLQLTGVNGIENKIWTKKDLIKFENAYKNICPRRPTLTYNPIYIKILK